MKEIGGCTNVVGVRDEQALYDFCIPQLESLPCGELISPTAQLPASCKGQFIQ